MKTSYTRAVSNERGFVLFGAMFVLAMIPTVMLMSMQATSAIKRASAAVQAAQAKRNMLVITNFLTATALDSDNDGNYELVKESVGNLLPASLPVAPVDAYGTAYTYCTWDLGALNSDVAYSQNNVVPPKAGLVARVISAGRDKTFQTTCLSVESGGDDVQIEIRDSDVRYTAGTINGWAQDGDSGTVRLLNPADNVGIGVTTPTHKFEIAGGTTAAEGMAIGEIELYRSGPNTLVLKNTNLDIPDGDVNIPNGDLLVKGEAVIGSSGEISATSLSVDGTMVIDATRNLVGINGVSQNLVPTATNTYDLGAVASQFNNIYGNNIYQNGNKVIDTSALSGTTNYVSKFTGANSIGVSIIFDNGAAVGIGTETPGATLDVAGSIGIGGTPVLDGSRNLVGINSVAQALLPAATDIYDIGSPAAQFGNVYAKKFYMNGSEFLPADISGTAGSIPKYISGNQLRDSSLLDDTFNVKSLTNFDLPASTSNVGQYKINGVPMLVAYGSGNFYLGNGGNFTTTGNDNYAMGANALAANTNGSSNIALGKKSLELNTTGTGNTSVGLQALAANTTSSNNTAYGIMAGMSLTGQANTAIGAYSLQKETQRFSVAVGINSQEKIARLAANEFAPNTSLGSYALRGGGTTSNTPYNNVAIGYYALAGGAIANFTSSQNVSVGDESMSQATSASSNVAIGYYALRGITTGTNNVGIGKSTNSGTTNTYMTLLGSGTGVGASTGLTYGTAIGADASVTGSNAVILGRTTDNVGIGVTDPGTTNKLLIKGGTATNAANALLVQNSAGETLFGIRNDGALVLNGGVGTAGQILTSNGNGKAYWGTLAQGVTSDAEFNTRGGTSALVSLTTAGTNNTAFGYSALYNVISTDGSTAIGSSALFNSIAASNTAIGTQAGYSVTTSSAMTLLGANTSATATGLSYGTAVGAGASVTGSNAIILGRTTDNVGIGVTDPTSTNKLLIKGSDTTSGANALKVQDSTGATLFGIRNDGAIVLNGGVGTAGQVLVSNGSAKASWGAVNVISDSGKNTMAGTSALPGLNLGFANSNTAFGYQTLYTLPTGSYNTGVGTQAGYSLTSSAAYNTAIGASALYTAYYTSYNTAIGAYSQIKMKIALNTSPPNTSIGALSLGGNTVDNTGYGNVAIGYRAMYGTDNQVLSGYENVAVGNESLSKTTSGFGNVAVGTYALKIHTNSSNNVAIGYNAGSAVTTSQQVTLIGSSTSATNTGLLNATAIGYQASVTASNTLVLGNTSTSVVIGATAPTTGYKLDVIGASRLAGNTLITGNLTVSSLSTDGAVSVTGGVFSSSDVRFKKNFIRINQGNDILDRMAMISGFYYDWRRDEFKSRNFNDRRQIGVKAQDVEAVFPELVNTDKEGYKSVAYDKLAVIAIEGLNAHVKETRAKLNEHEKRLNNHDQEFQGLREENEALRSQIEAYSQYFESQAAQQGQPQ